MKQSTSARRAALLAASLRLLTASGSDDSSSAARRTVYYQDNSCRLEAFREYYYNARAIEPQGGVRRVDFDECYPRGSTGAITTCDPDTGVSTIETYLDADCNEHLYSSADSPQCENLKVAGDTCPFGGPASASTDCTSMQPYEGIDPGHFNLVGSPYKDRLCTERSGGDHIVSGSAFGVGTGGCSYSPLVRGHFNSITECMSGGSVYARVFGPDDGNCNDDLYHEVVMFAEAGTSAAGGICAQGTFDDGSREYYRITECTTSDETEKVSIGPTPAPTPVPPTPPVDDSTPAPVNYRGDGDDEDLWTYIDDDSSSHYYEDAGDDHVETATMGGVSDTDDHDEGSDDTDDKDEDKDHDDKEDDDKEDDDKEDDDKEDDDEEDDSEDKDDDEDDHEDSDDDESDDDSESSSEHHDDEEDDDCDDDKDEDDDDKDEDDDDSESDSHADNDSDSDSDSESDSDSDCSEDAESQGSGKKNKSRHKLTGNEIFAIVFGCSVFVAIYALAAVLAIAGGESSKKVGPPKQAE